MIFLWPCLPSLLVKEMSHQTYDPYILWGLYGDLPVVKYDVTVGQGHVLSKVATHTPGVYMVIFTRSSLPSQLVKALSH